MAMKYTILLTAQLCELSWTYCNIGEYIRVYFLWTPVTAQLLGLLHSNISWVVTYKNIHTLLLDQNISPRTQITAIVKQSRMEFRIYDIFWSLKTKRTERIQFASWTIGKGLFIMEDFSAADHKDQLRGRTIRAIGTRHMPYVYMSAINGTTQLSGFSVEVTSVVTQSMNANPLDVSTMEPVYGNPQNGTFTGLLGRIHKREFDLSINNIAMTINRHPAGRYIIPLNSMDLTICYEAPPLFIPSNTHWLPFPLLVWTVTFALLFLSIVCLAIITSVVPKNENLESSLSTSKAFYLLTWTFLVNVFKDTYGLSAKITYTTLLLGAMMTFQAYSAELFSNLSNLISDIPVKSMRDLAEQNVYRPITNNGTIYIQILMESKRSDYSAVWKTVLANGNKSFYPISEAHRVFREKAVLIGDMVSFQAMLPDQCRLLHFKEPNSDYPFVMFSRSDFPYRRMMYKRMIRLYESGLILHYRQKHMIGTKRSCDKEIVNLSFGINQVILPFIILLAGCLLAILTLVAEIMLKLGFKCT